jgi:DNA-binding CsgD family transcriptional regulator
MDDQGSSTEIAMTGSWIRICSQRGLLGRREGEGQLAAEVLEFRRSESAPAECDLLDSVTIWSRADIASASSAFERAVRGLGFKPIVWPDVSTMEPIVDVDGQPLASSLFGWEAHEVDRLHDYQGALRAPWLLASRVESDPFWINANGIFTRWKSRHLNAIQESDFGDLSFGQAAIVVPLHMPFGKIAVAAFVSATQGKNNLAHEFACHADRLASLSARFVQGYIRATRDERYLPTKIDLTDGQIQCLRWAAQGKTDNEIAIILGCSHAAIRYHVGRACERLGTVNRAHSVFRAAQLGYLS